MTKFINPYTDFGFKKLFGEEANKDLLIDFLNQLLPLHHQIRELEFRNGENMGDFASERKAIFDIHCKATSGDPHSSPTRCTVNGLGFNFSIEYNSLKVRYLCLIKISRL
jgi:hypothetical protein